LGGGIRALSLVLENPSSLVQLELIMRKKVRKMREALEAIGALDRETAEALIHWKKLSMRLDWIQRWDS